MPNIIVRNEAHWHELRAANIGSSDQPALWGVSPFKTPFQLWHEKRGTLQTEDLSENLRVICGKHLEAGIAMAIAEIHKLKIRKTRRYIAHPTVEGMGASLDYEVATDDGWLPLEIKNVDFMVWRDEWLHDGDAHEPPEHIDIQIQHQISCTESPYAMLGVLVGGNTLHLIRRDRHEGIVAAIKAKVVAFWKSIADGIEPDIDAADDLDALLRVRTATDGSTIDLRGDSQLEGLLADWAAANAIEGEASLRKDICRAEILGLIGHAEKVVLQGGSINAKTQPAHEGFERVQVFKPQPARRDLRVFTSKATKETAASVAAEFFGSPLHSQEKAA